MFDYLLTYPLSNLVDGNRETGIIFVDGLDEAEVDGENTLAKMFANCVERLPGWIRFVFTSRPERNVTKYFQSYETIDITDDMPKGYNDIMAYLVKSLSQELNQISNKLELLNKICELSEGIFLYAELLVTDIKDGSVKISDVGTFPKGLNAFYHLSMQRKYPTREAFKETRGILELLCISEAVPEELVRRALELNQYLFITCLDKMGSWVNRFGQNEIYLLGFSHKSLKDWFTNRNHSGEYYVDNKAGALKLAHYCRKYIDHSLTEGHGDFLGGYIRTHIGSYYVIAERYGELEDFLISHNKELDPYWRVWEQFPNTWDHTALLDSFWKSGERNAFLRKLQREGDTSFLLWILETAEKKYGLHEFSQELISIYMDTVHMSGQYEKAVHIADKYLAGHFSELKNNEFLAMLSVRRIHHSMFYKPVGHLIEDAMTLYSQLDESFPVVYNELLFLIGGNLGVLFGNWEFCKNWLDKSAAFAKKFRLEDFKKRNARKMADYYCHLGDYEEAKRLLTKNITSDKNIAGRYEAYLVGALANLYTCVGKADEAMKCYEQLMQYTTTKGIIGWVGHANLGIANVNFKLGNLKEAVDFARRSRNIYSQLKHEWGLTFYKSSVN